ncbi:DUF302 domain-containing protein [Thiothrix subterranea]|uniref:DUF302 domain-containing protein n=1 Tax=Thiothrix subterranea TaxID=2735563 RepID=A0AA51QXC3_9GAMM|nr:DUF302 domain-containing protein [Thiothrix subterranea]MDQ5769528.1 DUF302 domain-containing protein [Thiothrix subterranea]QQZ29505.1 DUF302 domain-containing protein [Thiothrix subterranea]WML87113.1 DUF302 domain-containing protein [Thiothrix subterranea]
MNFIRNILAIIGLVAIVGGAFAYTKFAPMMAQMGDMDIGAEKAALDSFDPKAKDVYMEMWTKLKASGNSADATVVKYSLADGVTWQDAEESMKSIANKLNIKAVGELPLSEQVQLETGKEQRFLKIYQFCNPQTAMKMVDFSDAFSAYLPCRIAMIEDKEGKYHLYSLNMDMMIYGGKTLPPELHAEALGVQEIMTAIMKGGAEGDF